MSTAEQTQAAEAGAAEAQEGSLLDKIISEGKLARDDEQRALARDFIGEFVDQVMAGTMTVSNDTQAMINARIGQIDRLLSKQLNAIMHHEDFQKLEGSWRGLHYFVHQSETGKDLKIKLMNVSKKDLLKDMEKAPEFDQSALFKKVYEEEFGTFGGAPFGSLIGDYEFGRGAQDVALLEKISNVAAAAHAPFIAAASPHMFNWDGFTEIGGPRDLTKIFETPDYVKWRSFRNSEDSRYVGPDPAPHPHAGCPTAPRPPRSRRSTTSRTWTGPTTRSTCGATPPTRSPAASPSRSPSTTGARRSEGSRAAGWSPACRRTRSRPTRGTWR